MKHTANHELLMSDYVREYKDPQSHGYRDKFVNGSDIPKWQAGSLVYKNRMNPAHVLSPSQNIASCPTTIEAQNPTLARCLDSYAIHGLSGQAND